MDVKIAFKLKIVSRDYNTHELDAVDFEVTDGVLVVVTGEKASRFYPIVNVAWFDAERLA